MGLQQVIRFNKLVEFNSNSKWKIDVIASNNAQNPLDRSPACE